MTDLAFSPLTTSVTIAATGTTANAVLPGAVGAGQTVRVSNLGAVPGFVNFGLAGVTATLTSIAIAANESKSFSIAGDITHVAAILTTAGPQNLAFQRGFGS